MAELFSVVIWTLEIGSWAFVLGLVILLILALCWYSYSKGFQDGMSEERLEHVINDGGAVTCCDHGVPHRYTCSQCTKQYLEDLRSMHSPHSV